ncbi:MAG TPA: PilZ domain-containing protein [Candidatus Acidoferrum sp.]|nr:PilZ domain-containing protein [Candidatus Acidoferrum sp.]
MSATNRAPQLHLLRQNEPNAKACVSAAAEKAGSLLGAPAVESPALKVLPLLRPESPRRFVRVPTHAVGVFPEHREYPRASLRLPLRLRSVNRIREDFPITLVTRDISSTGVYFLCPKQIALNTPIELEIVLVSRPMGRGNVVIVTLAHVRRTEPAAVPRWYGIAASYDDVQFDRDDGIPSRFLFL